MNNQKPAIRSARSGGNHHPGNRLLRDERGAQAQATGAKTTPDTYQTLYLTNLTQQNDAMELMNDLRNMLPNAKMYYVPSQSAFSIRASAEDLALAQKILADLDKTKKIYRLTYTMTERDGGKTIGVQHFSIIVASGSRTDFKQGSRVPITVATNAAPGSNAEMTYIDIGQEIEASFDGYLDGVRLRTKVVQSSIAEDKSGVGTQTSRHSPDHARRNLNPGPGQSPRPGLARCPRQHPSSGSGGSLRTGR